MISRRQSKKQRATDPVSPFSCSSSRIGQSDLGRPHQVMRTKTAPVLFFLFVRDLGEYATPRKSSSRKFWARSVPKPTLASPSKIWSPPAASSCPRWHPVVLPRQLLMPLRPPTPGTSEKSRARILDDMGCGLFDKDISLSTGGDCCVFAPKDVRTALIRAAVPEVWWSR